MTKTFEVVLGSIGTINAGGVLVTREAMEAAIARNKTQPFFMEFRKNEGPPFDFRATPEKCAELTKEFLAIKDPVGCIQDLELKEDNGLTKVIGKVHIGGHNSTEVLKFLEGKEISTHIGMRGLCRDGKLVDILSYDIVENKGV